MERRMGKNTTSPKQPVCQFNDTPKSKARPTPMTRKGRATMKNVSTFTWQTLSKGKAGSSISGKSRTGSAQCASRKSRRSQAGTAITYHGNQKVVQTRQKTECSFTPTATNNYTARVYTWRNRVLPRALERLELLDAKVSRAVLRGRGAGNSILLPDSVPI